MKASKSTSVSKVRPEDRVWLGILAREPEANAGDHEAARVYLREAGFPKRIVDEHLRRLRVEAKRRTGGYHGS